MKLFIRLHLLTFLILCSSSILLAESDAISPIRLTEEQSNNSIQIANTEALLANEYYQIEVLFLYSPESLINKQNFELLNSYVDNIVEVANRSFKNSNLRLKVKKLGLVPSPVLETGEADEELQLIYKNPQVQSLREQYQADVVSFLVSHDSKNKHCGVAFILDKMDEFSNEFSYQILSTQPKCEDWVFTHELGHNLGTEHDLENSNGNKGLFENSHGFKFIQDLSTKRTIMAGQPGEVVEYFSSPYNKLKEVILGTQQANNADTINQSMAFVASFRGDSTVLVEPTISLSKKQNKKKCKFTIEATNAPNNTQINIYELKRKKKRKLIKNQNSDKLTFELKRKKKTKEYQAELIVGKSTYSSNKLKCKKKR